MTTTDHGDYVMNIPIHWEFTPLHLSHPLRQHNEGVTELSLAAREFLKAHPPIPIYLLRSYSSCMLSSSHVHTVPYHTIECKAAVA